MEHLPLGARTFLSEDKTPEGQPTRAIITADTARPSQKPGWKTRAPMEHLPLGARTFLAEV